MQEHPQIDFHGQCSCLQQVLKEDLLCHQLRLLWNHKMPLKTKQETPILGVSFLLKKKLLFFVASFFSLAGLGMGEFCPWMPAQWALLIGYGRVLSWKKP